MFNFLTVLLYTTDVNTKVVPLEGIPYSNIVNQIRNLVLEARAETEF
jgi:hypothetical protein